MSYVLCPMSYEYITWKSIVYIYSLEATTVQNLIPIKWQKPLILRGHHFKKEQQFDLDIWLCDLKINDDHVLSTSIHDIKFGNFKSEGSKILSGKHLYKDQQFDLEL